VENDIADVLEIRDPNQLLKVMQAEFETKIGVAPFFRITGTSSDLKVLASPNDRVLIHLLENPPGRESGWNVKPLPPLRRNALGFENDRIDFHHLKFIRNGHLEFWTKIDQSFAWMQDEASFKQHPRLYPYPVVEHPLSFCRLYKKLMEHLDIHCTAIFQMQYINVKGAILLPYRPESVGFMLAMDSIKPLERNRLVFPKHYFPYNLDPDLAALELVEDLYSEFGYGREQIPFFDPSGHVTEL
jgi:hypothetical protein